MSAPSGTPAKPTGMRAYWDRMRNIPGLGRNVVTVLVLVALGIASAGYILSNYALTWPWQDRTVLTAEFAKGPGLVAAGEQEVRIAGVPVGDVTAVTPTRDGIRAEITLDPGHVVYGNATMALKSKTPLNDPYVDLSPGGPPAAPLATDGSGELPLSQTTRLIQPFEILNKLDERTQVALTSLLNQSDVGLRGAEDTLPGSLRSATAALDTLRPVVEELRKRRGAVQGLVTDLAQISTAAGRDDARLARLVTSLQTTLSTVSRRDDELGRTLGQLPGLGGDLRRALGSTSELTTELNPVLGDLKNASEDLPPALDRLTDTLEQASPVLDGLRPVVAKAEPVVGDLRPLVGDLDAALGDLKPVTGCLPDATAQIAPWMPNLAAFVFQTSSAFSVSDPNGGGGRAQVVFDTSNPAGGVGSEPGDSPAPGDEARKDVNCR